MHTKVFAGKALAVTEQGKHAEQRGCTSGIGSLRLKNDSVLLLLLINSGVLLSNENLLLALLPLSWRGSVFCEMPRTECKPNIAV